jgi:hypothetical protein
MDMSKFSLGLACVAIACSVTGFAAGKVSAQTITNGAASLSDQTLKEAQQSGGSPYTINGSNLNFMQLIHNATLNGGRSPQQYQERQSDSLNSAVEGYKSQRTQELKLSPSTFSPAGSK